MSIGRLQISRYRIHEKSSSISSNYQWMDIKNEYYSHRIWYIHKLQNTPLINYKIKIQSNGCFVFIIHKFTLNNTSTHAPFDLSKNPGRMILSRISTDYLLYSHMQVHRKLSSLWSHSSLLVANSRDCEVFWLWDMILLSFMINKFI